MTKPILPGQIVIFSVGEYSSWYIAHIAKTLKQWEPAGALIEYKLSINWTRGESKNIDSENLFEGYYEWLCAQGIVEPIIDTQNVHLDDEYGNQLEVANYGVC